MATSTNSIHVSSSLIRIFECTVCYNIPSKKSMKLCENGHPFCSNCQAKLSKCAVCQDKFSTKPNTLVGKILDGITIDCKFKDYGCDKIINLVEQHKHQSTCQYRSTCKYEEKGCFHILQPGETSLDHENECVYRTVSCFHKECQPNGVIMPIKNLKDHYYKYHKRSGHVFNNVDEKEAFFEITATPGPISFFYQNGKPIFMFEGWLGVKDLKESVQGCLVTMKSPEEAKKLQCSIRLVYKGAEIAHHLGRVFSIDDTEDIRSLESGGMVYPFGIIKRFHESGNITFEIRVFKVDEILGC